MARPVFMVSRGSPLSKGCTHRPAPSSAAVPALVCAVVAPEFELRQVEVLLEPSDNTDGGGTD